MARNILKNDRFRKNRGGHSRLLEIACEKCDALACRYQKDGPGNLRRMYLDRITDARVPLGKKSLTCANGHLLGTRMIYEKEKRPAFRLFVDAVKKRIIKSNGK